VATVLKSGSLSLPEPSGPVQACNGIALPLPTFHGTLLPLRLVSEKAEKVSTSIPMYVVPHPRSFNLQALCSYYF